MNHDIGQQLIMGIEGKSLTHDESSFIIKNNIGGIILFGRNVESVEQVHELCTQIQSLRHQLPTRSPLFISVDQEGGRVARLKAPFTVWPPLAKVGDLDSTSVAFKFAQVMGEELKSVGINLDFAPCIDIFSNPQNTVIGDRALGTTADRVAKLGSAVVRGYIKSGIIPCAKHFPGHGDTFVDSHENLPVEHKTFEELALRELEPFKKVFRARLDLVMAAHILFPKIDPDWPATLSEIFLKKILRDQLRYRGLIITDDLDMGALKKNYDKATIAVRALQAGNNILLYCNESDSPVVAVDAITKALADRTLDLKTVSENASKIRQLKATALTAPDPLPMNEVRQILGHPDHLRLAKGIASGLVPADLLTQTT